MRSRSLAVIVAAAMLTVTVPAGTANHLSVGVHDTVGNEPVEHADDPSVPGDEGDLGTNDTPYAVGTTDRSHCYDAEAEVSADEIRSAAESHGFCGVLNYNNGTTFERVSPPDQVYHDDLVSTFDVQRVYWSGWFPIETCEPYCETIAGQDGPGNLTWNAVHTLGSLAGLTDGPEEADESEGEDREQTYYVNLDVASAPGLVQRETGAWTMDGWTVPAPFERFVGFLFDDQGSPVTDTELVDRVETLVGDGKLSAETTPQVCGYVPQRSFVSTGEQSFCDTPLLYRSSQEDSTAYDDPCQADTYICAPTTQPYWGSESVGLTGAYAGNQDHYLQWHWVIAPNQPDCAHTQPGFDLSGDAAGQDPFIAHDLDVYTPATAVQSTGELANLDGLDDYGDALEDRILDTLPAAPDEADTDEVYAFAADSTSLLNDDVQEPNHVGAETFAIDDDSRQVIDEQRSATTDPCDRLIADESPSTVDPWVNLLDNGVDNNRDHRVFSGLTGADEDPPTPGLYRDDANAQDEDNDPTVDEYSTDGFTGLFTDKDDDGEYEQITGSSDSDDTFSPEVYQQSEIYEVGAYPMLWDMHVTVDDPLDGASIDREGGCTFTGDQAFAAVMEDAGYGPNTGIAQAIYLQEPTVFEDLDTDDPQTIPYPGGNNIYLQLNQAGRALWDGEVDDGTDDLALSEEIDALIEELRDYLVQVHGVEEPDIREPGAVMGLDSDFFGQCNESTGGFDAQLEFVHNCATNCTGDTIATKYVYEVARPDGTIGGGAIPFFTVGGEKYDFGTGVHAWHDIDAFDGDGERDDRRMSPPPSGDA